MSSIKQASPGQTSDVDQWLIRPAQKLAVALVGTADQSRQRYQRWADVWASESGFPVYQRLGFTEVAKYDLWMKRDTG